MTILTLALDEFITIARPIAATFVAYGAPVDFIARMENMILALDAAEGRKYSGRDKWIGKTAALADATREAMRIVRKLQAVLNVLYRPNAELAAAWKAATHIERPPKRSPRAAVSAATPPDPNAPKLPVKLPDVPPQVKNATIDVPPHDSPHRVAPLLST